VRVAQILLAFRPNATETDKLKISVRADSLYNALKQGADFGQLAEKFSDDNLTYKSKGEMPAFGVAKYDSSFESAAFALEKDGDIGRPVQTAFGYHILKRIERIPYAQEKNQVKEKVLNSDRMLTAEKVFINNVKQKIAKHAPAAVLTSDSAILDYYRNHLENYNPEYAEQLNEFKYGNLLFTIMQKKIWDPSATDSAGLMNYYKANAGRYYWERSADALLITELHDPTGNPSLFSDPQQQSTLLRNWRELAEESNGALIIDSGRFELSRIPVAEGTNFSEGSTTAPVINEQDSSKTFAYIIKLYTQKEPKTFEEARGLVITDYQQVLEEKWIASLRKKYPVKINKKLLKSLP
jgi:peptidyl-prolyl cis-trans isomerase SurA